MIFRIDALYFAARRVVVIAIQQNVIDRRADFARGGIHEAEAHVAAGIFDTVEIAGDVAVRREQQNAAGVSEEIVLGIEGETEVRGFGRGFDGFFRTGEEMPAGIGFRTAEMSQRFLFLFGGHVRSLAGIEADENNIDSRGPD